MTRRYMIFVILTTFVLGATPTLGHEKYRIIGTLAKRQSDQLQVKNKDGKIFSIGMSKYTVIWRDKKKVQATELKVGQSVVVDAVGDSYDDLNAEAVTIVAAIGSIPSK